MKENEYENDVQIFEFSTSAMALRNEFMLPYSLTFCGIQSKAFCSMRKECFEKEVLVDFF